MTFAEFARTRAPMVRENQLREVGVCHHCLAPDGVRGVHMMFEGKSRKRAVFLCASCGERWERFEAAVAIIHGVEPEVEQPVEEQAPQRRTVTTKRDGTETATDWRPARLRGGEDPQPPPAPVAPGQRSLFG